MILHRLRKFALNWLPPLILAAGIILGLHPGVKADPAPTTSELATYLQTSQLELGTKVVAGYQQIYYTYHQQQVILTTASYNHTYQQASGPFVIWEGLFSGGSQIFVYNVLTEAETQLTFSGTNSQPSLKGNQVVWRTWDGNHWQINYFDGRQIRQLTSGDTSSVRASTDGTHVIYATQISPDDWKAESFDIASGKTSLVHEGDEASTAYPAFGPNGSIATAFAPY